MSVSDDNQAVITAALTTNRIARATHRAKRQCPADGAFAYLGKSPTGDEHWTRCMVCQTTLCVSLEDIDAELDKTPVETPRGKLP